MLRPILATAPVNAARFPKIAFSLFVFLTLSTARASAQAQPPAANAAVIYECENSICGTWTWDNGQYNGYWVNGSIGILTVQSFTAQSVILKRTDTSKSASSGLTAVYTGQISGQSKNVVTGSVTYTWPGHSGYPATVTWTGNWGAPEEFTISTVAGNGMTGFSGDGGQATSAALNGPKSVALDSAGNLYIADQGNQRIRRVAADGTITTIAGTGVRGYSGDGGPAISAELNVPTSVFVEASGAYLIADQYNNVVRLVSAAGMITTFAGSVQAYCGDDIPATSACINGPLDVIADAAGNVYICDFGNQRIRKVTNGIITTVAGNGIEGYSGDGGPATSASLSYPTSIALNAAGELFIADSSNHVIRKVSNGIITTVAGTGVAGYSGDGGLATAAKLNYPRGTRFNAAGDLYFADFGNEVVRVLLVNGTVFTVAGNFNGEYSGDNGPATMAGIIPWGVAIASSGAVYVAGNDNQGQVDFPDDDNQRIRLLTPAGSASTGTAPSILPTGGLLNGASFQAGIVPGSWVTIFGTNLSSKTDNWVSEIINGKLPTSLDDVQVRVGGQPAYISYISPKQIDAVVPSVATGPVEVTVKNSSGTSAPITTTAQAVQPAFFQWGNYAVATTLDYTLAVKNGTFPGVTTTPAKPGEVIILWGTGFGPTSPSAPTGVEAPSSPTYYTANTVTVTVGGKNATVYGAALAPGFAGLYQVAIQIPASLANGDYPLVAKISGAQSPSTTLITVQE